MVRFIFKIVFVQRGQEARWRGWAEPRRADHSIGRCELIEAHDIEEAVQTVKRRYPNFTVMREGSERICSASGPAVPVCH
jgi:hypothetical protein